MNDRVIKAGYEIAIRLLVFFIVGIVVTTLFSYDPLTGVIFWSKATDYCYSLMLGMIAVLVMGMAFAPKQCLEVWKELICDFYLWIKGKRDDMNGIKEITLDAVPKLGLKAFVELIQKLAARVKTTNAGEEVAMKHMQDGMQTAIVYLLEPEEGDIDLETGLPLTWGKKGGKPHLFPTVRVETLKEKEVIEA